MSVGSGLGRGVETSFQMFVEESPGGPVLPLRLDIPPPRLVSTQKHRNLEQL